MKLVQLLQFTNKNKVKQHNKMKADKKTLITKWTTSFLQLVSTDTI